MYSLQHGFVRNNDSMLLDKYDHAEKKETEAPYSSYYTKCNSNRRQMNANRLIVVAHLSNGWF
jgi:hypothetical protein